MKHFKLVQSQLGQRYYFEKRVCLFLSTNKFRFWVPWIFSSSWEKNPSKRCPTFVRRQKRKSTRHSAKLGWKEEKQLLRVGSQVREQCTRTYFLSNSQFQLNPPWQRHNSDLADIALISILWSQANSSHAWLPGKNLVVSNFSVNLPQSSTKFAQSVLLYYYYLLFIFIIYTLKKPTGFHGYGRKKFFSVMLHMHM